MTVQILCIFYTRFHVPLDEQIIKDILPDHFEVYRPFVPSDVTKYTPVFKKRPNFLNSSPTSTEDALRLLSAPSGRF
jgi:hypothetical protein